MPATKTIEARLRYEAQTELYRLEFRALGTNCKVAFTARGNDRAAEVATGLAQWVANFESKYSRFLKSSLVSEINRQAGKRAVAIDAETARLFDICASVYESTDGLIDPTALPLLRLWDYRATPPRIPSESEIAAARALVGWKLVQRDKAKVFLPRKGMELDLGGIGKEYAVDRVTEFLASQGIENGLVDFGGDIRSLGRPPHFDRWSIGIENPSADGSTDETLILTNQSVASSGNYRRNFVVDGRVYGHIVDPKSGRPCSESSPQIATVIAETCLKAGILATTSCLLGLDAGIAEIESAYPAEGRIQQNRKIASTKGFHEYVLIK